MPSMKLTALTALLALSTEGVDAKITKRKLEFIRTMRESQKIHGPIRGASKPNLAAFLRKSQEVSSLKGGKGPAISKEELERKLDNYAKFEQFIADSKATAASNADSNTRSLEEYEDPEYNGGQYNNQWSSNYNGYNGNSQNAKNNAWYNNFLKWFQNNNGNKTWEDEYGNSVAEMYGDNDGNRTYDATGLADLSIKYAGCSSTTSFMGEVDDEDGSASHFVPDTLVQYRLCPADSCQDNSWAGCRSEYGQYMMDLEDFLEIQSDLLDEEFNMICGYCNSCYQFDKSSYCEGGNCCSHSHDCGDYDDYCHGDGDDAVDPPDYEELFDCMEVDVNNETAYVGVHCNGIHIELGLFSDSSCTTLIATDETVDIANITGYDVSTEELEEFYVPEGCLTCGGDEYNWKSEFWYIDGDKNQENDDDYVNSVCYDMYEASAKCNANLNEDVTENLEGDDLSEGQQAIICNFIEDAILGKIDEHGFVYTREYGDQWTPMMDFWNFMTNAATEDPQFVTSGKYSSNAVTAGQTTALTLGAIGTAAMAAAAYYMKQQVDAAGAEGLIANGDKQID